MTPFSMIDIDTWPIKVTATVLGGAFLAAWSFLLGSIYITRKYLGRLLGAFSKSPEVGEWGARYSRGLVNRLALMAILADFVLFSRFYIKKGEVFAQDIQKLPYELKCILLIYSVLMCSSGAILATICVLVAIRSGASAM